MQIVGAVATNNRAGDGARENKSAYRGLDSTLEYILITDLPLPYLLVAPSNSHPRIKVEISSDEEGGEGGEVADKQIVAGKTDNYPGWPSPLFTYRPGGQ